MKAHRRKKQSILENYKINILLSSMVGIVSILVSTCLFALIVSNIDVNLKIISLMNIVCLAFGSYISGYISTIKRQKKGIICGTLCGIIISSVLIVSSLILTPNFNILNKVCKLIVVMVCSIIGGIQSANKYVA